MDGCCGCWGVVLAVIGGLLLFIVGAGLLFGVTGILFELLRETGVAVGF